MKSAFFSCSSDNVISDAGVISTLSILSIERWLCTSNALIVSTSSSKNSMRTGQSIVIGKISVIPPRTEKSPGFSTCVCLSYPISTSFFSSSSRLTISASLITNRTFFDVWLSIMQSRPASIVVMTVPFSFFNNASTTFNLSVLIAFP